MEGSIFNLRVASIKGQIEAKRLYSEALLRKLASVQAGEDQTRIAREYDTSLRQIRALSMTLGSIEALPALRENGRATAAMQRV